jgi:amino acid adenylation domain-containing protein/thioester reductase-like protein
MADRIRGWNETSTDYPRNECLHHLFEQQAAARPDAPAARHGGRELTYGELSQRSDRLASRLQAAGIGPGMLVGLTGARSLDALVALLGILKTGAAYVPLDDAGPPARLRTMVEDAGVHAGLILPGGVSRSTKLPGFMQLDDLEQDGSHTRPDAAVEATDCAYVMFTSGTTGRPKPVAIPHRGVVRLVVNNTYLNPRPEDRILQAYNLFTDASTIEIWSALLNGACLVLIDREVLLVPAELEASLRSERISVAFLTTSVFHHVARIRPGAFAGMRFVSAGGEALNPDLTRKVLTESQPERLVNFYGPTENSVVSTAHVVREVPPGATYVPIGRPIANSTCYIIRPDGVLADVNEEGELLVGGDGLSLGYIGLPEITAQHFIISPFHPGGNTRLYRTGDQARWLDDGTIVFCGRRDRQVKVRGFRVELEEIEAVLRAHPAVGEAIVEVMDQDGRSNQLVTYITPARPGRPIDLRRLQGELADWLPAHAVPSALVEVEQLPVAGNGKVDRQALARTRRSAEGSDADALVPPSQAALAELWATMLNVHPVAPSDNFFHLGGDSLLAAEMVTRALVVLKLDACHASTLVRLLLETPTLAEFATAVQLLHDENGRSTDHSGVDFEQEAHLDLSIPRAVGPPPQWWEPREVLLTGATGFVGAFLLEALLRNTGARVHCPVRARDTHHARRRVLANLARYNLSPAWPDNRVVYFPADLARPRLGLANEDFMALGGSLDLIVHSGAHVNFLYPYEQLRPTNVDGTREIIRLAMTRRVPIHFLSTIAVIAGFGTAGVTHVEEDIRLRHADRLTMGYAESKWVAEVLLQNAAAQGLPIAIYRPYEVTGEQQYGICNTETAICSLFKTITETGLAPDIDLPLDFVPVDYLTDAIVHIATQRPPTKEVYHLTNPCPAQLRDMVERLKAKGYDIRNMPYAEWVDALVRYVTQNPTSPTTPFVSLCVDRSNKADISVKEMYLTGVFPSFSRANAERALANSTLVCPPTDASLLDRYLDYFLASGYLAQPQPSMPVADKRND